MISFSFLPECSGTIKVTPIAIATINGNAEERQRE
jgi:hypothetical protein